MIATFLVLQFLDAMTTMVAIMNGGTEKNPSIAWLIDNHPLATLPAKAICLVPVTLVWLWLRKHSPRAATVVIGFGILAGFYAVLNNGWILLNGA